MSQEGRPTVQPKSRLGKPRGLPGIEWQAVLTCGMKFWISLFTCVAVAVLGGCARSQQHTAGHAVATNKAPHIIDVRTPREFAQGHVPGATNIPLDTINEQTLAPYAGDKSQPIFVHCRSGGRSARAKVKLHALGYTNVIDWGSLENARAMGTRIGNGRASQ